MKCNLPQEKYWAWGWFQTSFLHSQHTWGNKPKMMFLMYGFRSSQFLPPDYSFTPYHRLHGKRKRSLQQFSTIIQFNDRRNGLLPPPSLKNRGGKISCLGDHAQKTWLPLVSHLNSKISVCDLRPSLKWIYKNEFGECVLFYVCFLDSSQKISVSSQSWTHCAPLWSF